MLDLACKYEEEVQRKLLDTWYQDKYMFYHMSTYYTMWQPEVKTDGDWNGRYFVSLNSQGEVIGLISYGINRVHDLVQEFGAINFTNDKITFGKDLAQVIDDIFCKFNIRKLEFAVIVDNPVEKSYDRIITQYGGNITGIKHKHYKLMNGQFYDFKEYELFREDYLESKSLMEQKRLHKKRVEEILNEK